MFQYKTEWHRNYLWGHKFAWPCVSGSCIYRKYYCQYKPSSSDPKSTSKVTLSGPMYHQPVTSPAVQLPCPLSKKIGGCQGKYGQTTRHLCAPSWRIPTVKSWTVTLIYVYWSQSLGLRWKSLLRSTPCFGAHVWSPLELHPHNMTQLKKKHPLFPSMQAGE